MPPRPPTPRSTPSVRCADAPAAPPASDPASSNGCITVLADRHLGRSAATRLADVDDAQALAHQAADRLAVLTGVAKHDIALVLGSGWGAAATALGTPRLEVASEELPGF